MAKKGQKFQSFSKELKLMAVKMYFEQHKGIDTIAKELGLCSNSYIRRWLKSYREYGETGLEDRRGQVNSPNRSRLRKRQLTLEEENLRLRMENDYLKKLLEHEGWDLLKK